MPLYSYIKFELKIILEHRYANTQFFRVIQHQQAQSFVLLVVYGSMLYHYLCLPPLSPKSFMIYYMYYRFDVRLAHRSCKARDKV